MKQNWKKEIRTICEFDKFNIYDLFSVIERLNIEAKQEEREKILKNIKKFHKQRWKANHNMVENISLTDLVEYLGIVLNK